MPVAVEATSSYGAGDTAALAAYGIEVPREGRATGAPAHERTSWARSMSKQPAVPLSPQIANASVARAAQGDRSAFRMPQAGRPSLINSTPPTKNVLTPLARTIDV